MCLKIYFPLEGKAVFVVPSYHGYMCQFWLYCFNNNSNVSGAVVSDDFPSDLWRIQSTDLCWNGQGWTCTTAKGQMPPQLQREIPPHVESWWFITAAVTHLTHIISEHSKLTWEEAKDFLLSANLTSDGSSFLPGGPDCSRHDKLHKSLCNYIEIGCGLKKQGLKSFVNGKNPRQLWLIAVLCSTFQLYCCSCSCKLHDIRKKRYDTKNVGTPFKTST